MRTHQILATLVQDREKAFFLNAIREKEENQKIQKWISKKGRGADALALRAEERRDKLRKATVRSTYPVTRGCLNAGTHMLEACIRT